MKTTFTAKRQILKLIGSTVRFTDANDTLLLRADQKGFRLKEEVVFFKDEEKTQKLFSIKARSVIDLAAVYDIFNPNGDILFSVKRGGLASMFVADKWQILDTNGNQIGHFEEANTLLAVLRRYLDFISLLSPQHYEVFLGEQKVGDMTQNYNPLTLRLQCEFDDAALQPLSNVGMYAIPALVIMIEGRQS